MSSNHDPVRTLGALQPHRSVDQLWPRDARDAAYQAIITTTKRDQIITVPPASTPHRHVVRWAWAGGLTMAASSALALVLATGTSQAAYAVETMSNGQIKVNINNSDDFTQISGLQKALREHGVTTRLVKTNVADCPAGRLLGVAGANQPPRLQVDDGGNGIGFTIDPSTTFSAVDLLITTDDPTVSHMVPPADFGAGTDGVGWFQLGCTDPGQPSQPVTPSAKAPSFLPQIQPSR